MPKRNQKKKELNKTVPDVYDLQDALRILNSKQPNRGSFREISYSEPVTNNVGNVNVTIINSGTDDEPSESMSSPTTLTEEYIDSRINNIDAKYTKSLAEYQREVNSDINEVRKAVSNCISNGLFWTILGILITLLLALFTLLFNNDNQIKESLYKTDSFHKETEYEIKETGSRLDSIESAVQKISTDLQKYNKKDSKSEK